MLSSINYEQKLYVLKCGDGFTCLGFEYAAKQAEKVNNWLPLGVQIPATLKGELGSNEAYEYYEQVMRTGGAYAAKSGKRCEADLIPQFKGLEGMRVEVTEAGGEKRKYRIGKSTGWMPCHLEMQKGQDGGIPVMPFISFRVLKR